jgi:integrase
LPRSFTIADARSLANCIDEILAARKRGGEARVQSYLATAPALILDKLARVGLVDLQPLQTIGESLDLYLDEIEAHLAPSTFASTVAIFKRLKPAFDLQQPVRALSSEQARLVVERATAGASPSYGRQILQAASAWFRRAVPGANNPFDNLAIAPPVKIAGRDFDVPAAWSSAILEACPDQNWRLAFSLWRYGGLRFKEVYQLQWGDVLFDRKRLIVHSSKTARYGKAERVVPLFPEIDKEITAQFLSGSAQVLQRETPARARRIMEAIIRRAGYAPWPRLFQNLRATRENELIAAGFPAHIVAAWLGHTTGVQSRYYLRVLDSYFGRATGGSGAGEIKGENKGDFDNNGSYLVQSSDAR